MSGMLFVVATPIGNLGDISARALEVLRGADVIVCEDTRVTSKLLRHFSIQKSFISLHEHSENSALAKIVNLIQEGKSVAYTSDAGTPGVNDPGGKLVAACFEKGIPISPIPGPSALTTAISVCGFPMNEFVYLGFAPHKKGRETFFREIASRSMPSVFFESTHRILKTMDALSKILDPSRLIFCGRELTKMHETLYRGTIDEVRAQLQATSTKGELVVIVGLGEKSSRGVVE